MSEIKLHVELVNKLGRQMKISDEKSPEETDQWANKFFPSHFEDFIFRKKTIGLQNVTIKRS